jgi:prophage regulatory protein
MTNSHDNGESDEAKGTVEFLTDAQFAALMHVDDRTTLRWRTVGDGPPFVRVGPRRILYRRTDVDAWLAARTFPHRAAEAVVA